MLIDTHSHLHFHKSFPDYQEVLERAREAGVTRQILIGCEMSDSLRACQFAQQHDQLNWVIGIHPHEANQVTEENLKIIRQVLGRTGEFSDLKKLPVAVGEIGLDYFRNIQSPDKQREGFRKLLEIAMEFDLPVVIHIREAFDDARKILEESTVKKAVLHCFSGGMEQADWAWERGFLTSFTGSVTYPKNTVLMEVAKKAPAEMYMLETDCPYLPPQIHRGKRNEPAYVLDIAKHVAELRGISLESVAAETTGNAEKFFYLGKNNLQA